MTLTATLTDSVKGIQAIGNPQKPSLVKLVSKMPHKINRSFVMSFWQQRNLCRKREGITCSSLVDAESVINGSWSQFWETSLILMTLEMPTYKLTIQRIRHIYIFILTIQGISHIYRPTIQGMSHIYRLTIQGISHIYRLTIQGWATYIDWPFRGWATYIDWPFRGLASQYAWPAAYVSSVTCL